MTKYIDVATYCITQYPIFFISLSLTIIAIVLMSYEAYKQHEDFISYDDIEEE